MPIKNIEQQAILSVHRARQGLVKARTAQANQIRGLLSEFGIVIPQGIHSIAKRVPDIMEDAENGLPGTMRHLLERLNDHLKDMGRQAEELKLQIKLWHKENKASKSWRRFPVLARSRRVLLWRQYGMPQSIRTADNWRHGWDWSPSNTLVAVSRYLNRPGFTGDSIS